MQAVSKVSGKKCFQPAQLIKHTEAFTENDVKNECNHFALSIHTQIKLIIRRVYY